MSEYEPQQMQPGEVWSSDRMSIVMHFDGCFELMCDGEPVMPCGSFDCVTKYLWAEFKVL